LKLSRSVELNKNIQIASLPQKESSTYPVPNQPAWVVGWGKKLKFQISNLTNNNNK